VRQVETRYATSGTAKIAYQVIGQGSLDLVLIPGFISNLELLWELPGYDRLVRRLSTFTRLILFDKRGSGLSDRFDPDHRPDFDQWADDISAVLDAVGSNRAALIGSSDGGALAIRFAARNPARVRALVVHGGYTRFLGSVMDARKFGAMVDSLPATWGRGATVTQLAPSLLSDDQFVEWWARFERLSASPTSATLLARLTGEVDVQDDLDHLACPVMVIHRTDDAYVKSEVVQSLARRIPGVRLVELPGRDHPIWLGDTDRIVDEIAEFLTGERPTVTRNQVLAALLVARFVSNRTSSNALHMNDEHLDQLREAVPKVFARFHGHVSWSGSDKFVVRLDSASRAIQSAIALRDTAALLGLAAAQGIHVAEVDISRATLSDPSLEIPARIANTARPGEIMMSRLAKDLVSGSGLQFLEHGSVIVDGRDSPVPVVIVATERHLEPMGHHAFIADPGTLSPRERQVLALVADGLSNPAIAVQLGLSQHTVKRHVANILLKLDLPSRAAAAASIARHAAG
jgi:pimeloyl-ACP methyl ester carboxylesterase/DNA-binding CsgD family transcriptional regulator